MFKTGARDPSASLRKQKFWSFAFWSFDIVSNFGFRYSNLEAAGAVLKALSEPLLISQVVPVRYSF
jgi:hypothetical protein